MSQLWNSFKIAFSMYSKIPMPYSDWSKENMKYAMGFFPLVGAAVGAVTLGAAYLLAILGLPDGHLFRAALLTVLPVLITGGIHLDGFLDTSDALSSWQERERRLEILKDSHAGAFAIICCAVYMVLYLGAVSLIPWKSYFVLGLSFIQIRAFSGLSVVTFPMAKNTGLAAAFSDSAHKRVIRVWLLVMLIFCTAGMIGIRPVLGTVCTAAVLLVFFYYRHMSMKNFGGINGDLAGWFLQVAELAAVLAAAVVTFI
ncbi:MAG: adenosylcobinamide-GDP ribazoletransferase [Blautia sp.]|jgi:adenosylcobinamide-GDP ribazoletransferase